jgi:tRNA A-37 threonylcarbamoyl transferase component Bud32
MEMNPPKEPIAETLSTLELERIIAVCERFEADWKAGRPGSIEAELAAADEAIRPELFRELLALEVELRRRRGEIAEPDVYLARFPDHGDTIRKVIGDPARDSPGPVGNGNVNGEAASPLEGYEFLERLGKGGQASTYLARDRALQRLVVVKRYHGVDSTSRRAAVLNEGRALARVGSRFVAQCYEVNSRGGEIDLIVEYVPGRPLSELTVLERADTARCARLVEQVAEGLAEVHACGLLHRDIKPQNVLLGDDGVPRLVDFGLAVPVASEALQGVAGSPPYMAPEQARGQGERVDARTDVYGLGAVLYFLLTGQPPHEGKTRVETLAQARAAPIVPPRRLNPRVPRVLERICLHALEADPRARYPSAEALGRALHQYALARRAAPVLGAVTVLVAVLALVSSALWLGSGRLGGGRQGPALETSRPAPAKSDPTPTPTPVPALLIGPRVTRFEIAHFPKLDEDHFDRSHAGILGRRSFLTREDDEVTVRAELSAPGYAYLIAFRPDGHDELCDPDDEDTPPSRKLEPMYPALSRTGERYRLTEGSGLQVFALVVSHEPLPSYRVWKQRHGPAPWSAKLAGDPGVIWRDDNLGLQPLLANDPTGIRSKGFQGRGSGGAAAKLASWLRGLPGVDAVTLEAFPVVPALRP